MSLHSLKNGRDKDRVGEKEIKEKRKDQKMRSSRFLKVKPQDDNFFKFFGRGLIYPARGFSG